MSATAPSSTGAVSRALARNRLGWKTLGGFVLAAAAPLTVVGGGVTNGWAVTGLTGIPAAYWAIAILLAMFAAGYTAMAQRLPNAGAFYTYITAGLGRPAGVAAGLVAAVSYCTMQIGLYGGLGVVGSTVLAQVFGLHVPWWACVLVGWALIGACGILKVDFNGTVLGALLLVEVVLILVFDGVELAHPHGGHVSAAALSPTTLVSGGLLGMVALVIALTGDVGFEDGPNYVEEARHGAPARAVFASLVITAVLYAGSSWAMTVAAGVHNVVAGSKTNGTEYMFVLVGPYLPKLVLDLGHVLFITSLFAAGLSFHNTFNRYCFAMARDRVLPYGLSRTWGRTRAPAYASVLQSVIALVAIIVVAVTGANPQVTLFFDGTVAAGFGVLLLLCGCGLAVLVYFALNRRGENVLRVFVLPTLALVGLLGITVVTVRYFGTLMGVPNNSTLARALPALFGVVIVLGVLWALVRRLANPAAYRRIGRGGDDTYTAIVDPDRPEVTTGTTEAVVLGGDA